MVRHILGISGGKDSAALAIYMKDKYPDLKVDYYNSDTGCELEETEVLINRLESYLGGITRLRAAEGSPEPTPFEHFLKASGNFLPSPQADIDVKVFNKAVYEYLKTTDLPVGQLDEFPLIDNDDVLVKDDIFSILEDSGVGVPAYYKPVEFEVDGRKGTYSRSRSGCYFCFYQQKIEWIWLYEQHPDLFKKAMEFEKDGYTWNQHESLSELIKPERVRQIKLDAIKKQEAKKKQGDGTLLGQLDDDEELMCANCFI